ncbi:hypothetical protein GCM10017786_00900 [Amycolatopsis deserti]|uniref:Insertion element IS402-like domain-containing protein n=1 Tax=Amycolatopsis deserti TaxID=185696 RepID=A0ABQ3I9V1_9PSEU|nr:transposase [Amycolatopsis deserti]GHE75841.1 hypothetical protein GCM10017786_00900 [Amycolatopsis deserti]
MLLVVSRFRLLSDEQWALIEDSLPVRTGKPGRPFADARAMVEGIIVRYRCGIAWLDVPPVFGPWQTIWTWHRRLAGEGTWDVVLQRLLAAADAAGEINWGISVDSTIARAHQHATNITRHAPGLRRMTRNPGASRLTMRWAAHGVSRARNTLCHRGPESAVSALVLRSHGARTDGASGAGTSVNPRPASPSATPPVAARSHRRVHESWSTAHRV